MKNKKALIDTDILSFFLKGNSNVQKNIGNYLQVHEILEFSLITYYEILSGLMAKKANKQIIAFENFCNESNIIPFTEKSAEISAELYANLRKSGKPLDDIDILIAGIARENDMILVTNNEKHFSRIESLTIQNWFETIY